MYARPAWCVKKAKYDTKRRPVILCEYAHAMGNSGGCLAAYWACFRDERLPRMQGGFIWDLVDQGLLLHESSDGSVGYGYGGDFGDVPNTRQFCINGILGPDREVHPCGLQAAWFQSQISIEFHATGEHICQYPYSLP